MYMQFSSVELIASLNIRWKNVMNNINQSSMLYFAVVLVFSARCNIYISRLCYDVSVHLSVCDGSALAHYS